MNKTNEVTRDSEKARATAWLSEGFESLQRLPAPSFDVVIVGSGYGGAVAAAELAGARKGKAKDDPTVSVCVLERGSEYLPGSFPSRMSEVAGHVRYATPDASATRGVATGLFDVRTGSDVCALLASGLGGGSLINAGVLAAPHASIFNEAAWPGRLRVAGALDPFLEEAGTLLGAKRSDGRDNTIGNSKIKIPAKVDALKRLDQKGRFVQTPISIGLDADTRSSAGVKLDQCLRCGDCATGCNHGAKNSLDVNLLVRAKRQGAKIYTGATVMRVREAAGGGWTLSVVPTDPLLRRREGEAFSLHAQIVIFAAGTFGSTEILLRSASESLAFSAQLGRRVSTNGDMIAVAYDLDREVNAVATESVAADQRDVGPTITAMIDERHGNQQTDLVIQDLSIPGTLRRLLEECVTTTATLDALARADLDPPARSPRQPDNCAVNPRAIARSLPMALMGRDAANGRLRFSPTPDDAHGDGTATVDWPSLRDDPRFEQRHARLVQQLRQSGMKGHLLANPMWRPLPPALDKLFALKRGPLFTVHPLGGCAMGDDAATGVVNDFGEVFNGPTGNAVHPGMLVLDGSVIPCSLGINPALTIAALALRAARHLRDQRGWTSPTTRTVTVSRKIFREVEVVTDPTATRVELIERMRGWVPITGTSGTQHVVELTLRFEPKRLDELFGEPELAERRRLKVADGTLRILTQMPSLFEETEDEPGDAVFEAKLSGTLELFREERCLAVARSAVVLPAWALNRGWRDLAQGAFDRLVSPSGDQPGLQDTVRDLGDRSKAAWRLSTHAGVARLFEYALKIERVVSATGEFQSRAWVGAPIAGVKRLTYARDANPWRQLMNVTLQQFPGLRNDKGAAPTLELSLPYWARHGVPLLRIVEQQDHPAALVDVTSFVLYFIRILLRVHFWSLRLPDAPSPREAARLPGFVPGLPPPEVTELLVPARENVPQATIVLTRYRPAKPRSSPVLLIHGYSASGTTFAHPAIPCSLAQYLCNELGRDVWIVDLRTSAGLATATSPWSLEDVGCNDIPCAVKHVLAVTGQPNLDIVAHCMGAAMLSMALLDKEKPLPTGSIRRLVLSQVGPAVVMSPANLFRAYVMRYLKHYLPLDGYTFRPPAERGLGGQLLDRLLATLPYPANEFELENPLWPPGARTSWVGTRHRMDALYGRDFELANMPAATLEHIDDFFGPLNLDTVTQVIHFARFRRITDRTGFNSYTDSQRIKERFTFPVLSIHGEENGLADKATLAEMERLLARDNLGVGGSFEARPIPGYGHQDCLLGINARRDVFPYIGQFLTA